MKIKKIDLAPTLTAMTHTVQQIATRPLLAVTLTALAVVSFLFYTFIYSIDTPSLAQMIFTAFVVTSALVFAYMALKIMK